MTKFSVMRHSNLLTLILVGCLFYGFATAASVETEFPRGGVDCAIVQASDTDRPYIAIRESGKYCLDRDYLPTCSGASSLWNSGCRGLGISIEANDVELDLRHHVVRALNGGGVSGTGRNIVIKNGIFRGAGISLNPPYRQYGITTGKAVPYKNIRPKDEELTMMMDDPKFFSTEFADMDQPEDETFFVVENVTFEGPSYFPLELSGAHNTIRNNKFKVRLKYEIDRKGTPSGPNADKEHGSEPQVTILNYGPNALIENNEIIQHTDNKGVIPTYTIYLRNAQGSIVRNNRITLKGDHKQIIAIGLRDTKDAVIENNVIHGAQTPVDHIGDSSSQQKDNQIK